MLSEVSEMSFSEVLVDSSREVFETMIFMSVEETFDEDAFSDEETINASILFYIGSQPVHLTDRYDIFVGSQKLIYQSGPGSRV